MLLPADGLFMYMRRRDALSFALHETNSKKNDRQTIGWVFPSYIKHVEMFREYSANQRGTIGDLHLLLVDRRLRLECVVPESFHAKHGRQ